MSAFVDVRNGPFRGVSRLVVRRWAERMLASLDLARAELSVALTNDAEIHELNRVFRYKDRPTDVLAFAMREGEDIGGDAGGPDAPEILGDVVISVETAREQAAKRSRPLEAEVRMLLAHGLLHLIGYDHQTDRQEAIMTKKTRALCRVALLESPKKRSAKKRASAKRASTNPVTKKRASAKPASAKPVTKKPALAKRAPQRALAKKRAPAKR